MKKFWWHGLFLIFLPGVTKVVFGLSMSLGLVACSLIGILIESFTDANNNMLTVGGTTTTRVYYKVEYEDGTIDTYHSGEVMKHFD